MKYVALLALTLFVTGCNKSNDDNVGKLAERLANQDAVLPADLYLACGREALTGIPHEQLVKALNAPDVPAIWAALGDKALNHYVQICRKAEEEHLSSKTANQKPSTQHKRGDVV